MDSLKVKGSPEKLDPPEKTTRSDCCPSDSTCDLRLKNMAALLVEYTTMMDRIEAKIDHVMAQNEALKVKKMKKCKTNSIRFLARMRKFLPS